MQHEETEESEESEEEEEEAGVRRSSRRTRVQVFFPLKFSYFPPLNDFDEVATSSVSDPDLIRIQSGQRMRIQIRNPHPDLGGQK